jgi:hypothetical protein
MSTTIEETAKAQIRLRNEAFLIRCRSLRPGDQGKFEEVLRGVIFRRPGEDTLYTPGVKDCWGGVKNATKVVRQGTEGFVLIASDTSFFRCEDPIVVVAITRAL